MKYHKKVFEGSVTFHTISYILKYTIYSINIFSSGQNCLIFNFLLIET